VDDGNGLDPRPMTWPHFMQNHRVCLEPTTEPGVGLPTALGIDENAQLDSVVFNEKSRYAWGCGMLCWLALLLEAVAALGVAFHFGKRARAMGSAREACRQEKGLGECTNANLPLGYLDRHSTVCSRAEPSSVTLAVVLVAIL
jgi:hypothetical protein